MKELQFLCRRQGQVESGQVAGLGTVNTVFRWVEIERLFFTCLRNSSKRYSKGMAYLGSFHLVILVDPCCLRVSTPVDYQCNTTQSDRGHPGFLEQLMSPTVDLLFSGWFVLVLSLTCVG